MKDESFLEPFERLMPAEEAQSILSSTSHYDWFTARSEAVKRYGYAVPCEEAIIALVSLSPLVEIGAGSGHWSRLVRAFGGDIVATDAGTSTDRGEEWSMDGIERLSAYEAIKKYPDRNLFTCWPSYECGWAANAIHALKPGLSVAYIGESRGGCTADYRFFDLLGEEFDEVMSIAIPRWEGIHDYLTTYRKKTL